MAVTIALTDLGSYHRLYCTGTGTVTDDDLYQYAFNLFSDERYITRTGSPGSYVYTFLLQAGESYVQTRINAGVTWQREVGATWNQEYHATSSSTFLTLYIFGTMALAENCVFDATSNTTTYGRAYLYCYGNMTGTQSLGNEAIFQGYRSFYWPMNNILYTTDIDHVIFQDVTYSSGYMLYFYGVTNGDGTFAKLNHSFKHITVRNTKGIPGISDGEIGTGYVYFYYGNYGKMILEDWTFEGLENTTFNYNSAFKMVRMNHTLSDNYMQIVNNGYAQEMSRIKTSKTAYGDYGTQNQPMGVFEDCTWDRSDNGVWENIVSEADAGGGDVTITFGTTNGFSAGDKCNILGTDNYDGLYVVQSKVGSYAITITATWAGDDGAKGFGGEPQYQFRTLYDGVYLLKGTNYFKNGLYGMYAYYSQVRLYNFTGVYENLAVDRAWAGSGTFLHSRALDLTVLDENSDPLENATVRIRTKLEKTVDGRDYPYEEFSFLTDENGEVKGCVEDSIYLTEKEEPSNGVFIQWSDGTGDNVHIIEISKEGYTLDTREVAMTEDKIIVAQLTDTPAGATTINGSTFYNSTIH